MTAPPGAAPRADTIPDVEGALRRVEDLLLACTASDEPTLTEMCGGLIAAGGKRLRPRIAILSFFACGGEDPTHAVEAAAAAELIHAASLVHDDIIDRSPLRRGAPSLHERYGLPAALVAGDFLFTKGFALSSGLGPAVVAATAEACVRLAEGEVLEQRLVDGVVTEDAYLRIIRNKTAEPMRAVARAGALLAGAPPHVVERFGEYGLALGMSFQITDDVLDVVGDPVEMGKAVGQDAKQGVVTLALGLPGGAPAVAQQVDRARRAALRWSEQAKGHLAAVPDSHARDELVRLAEDVVRRTR